MHGHSFRVRIELSGAQLSAEGWVEDFGVIRERLEPLRQQLDHHLLNEIEGLENPTSENLAAWLWPQVKQLLPALLCIEVHETCTAGCRYRGD